MRSSPSSQNLLDHKNKSQNLLQFAHFSPLNTIRLLASNTGVTYVHKSRCVQLSKLMFLLRQRSEVGMGYLQLDMNDAVHMSSLSDTYLFTCEAWKSTSSAVLLNECGGASKVCMSGQYAHSRARSQPPGRAAAHVGQHQTHERRTWPPRSDSLPGAFLCPLRTASPLPGCSQLVLLASSLLREEAEIIQFSAALFPPRTRNGQKRLEARSPAGSLLNEEDPSIPGKPVTPGRRQRREPVRL